MTDYTYKDHGVWRPYKPDVLPDWAVDAGIAGVNFLFLKRESDGVDFYEYRNAEGTFAAGSVVACTLFYPLYEAEIIKSVFFDHSMVLPVNQRLIEIDGVPAGTPSVHDLFTEKVFDPATLTVEERPETPVMIVSAAQAKTALFNTKLPDGTNVLDRVKIIVGEYPYEPVRIFYDSANVWEKANPYVRAIALELGLISYDEEGKEVDSGLDALFIAANKL